MIEKAVLAIVGVVAVLYAFRALAPSAWLARRVTAAADALRAAGWPRAARWVGAYAPSSGGCGGCGTCSDQASSRAAPRSAASGTEPSGEAGRDRASIEKPLTFHRLPRR